MSDKSELVFNLLEQEEIYDSNLRDLFNEEADGEDNISNDGGVQYSAHNAYDNDAHDGIPQYLRGKLDEGEVVTLGNDPEITHNDINLGELLGNHPSFEEEDLSVDGMQNGVSHPSPYVNDAADLSNNVGMVDGPPPGQGAVSSTNLKELLEYMHLWSSIVSKVPMPSLLTIVIDQVS